jgi:hypothetical protein
MVCVCGCCFILAHNCNLQKHKMPFLLPLIISTFHKINQLFRKCLKKYFVTSWSFEQFKSCKICNIPKRSNHGGIKSYWDHLQPTSTFSLPYVWACRQEDRKEKLRSPLCSWIHGFHDWDSVTSSLIKLFQTQSKYLLIILTLEIYSPKLKLVH